MAYTISSQPRYDHFDTAAYQIVRTQIRITVSILLAFFRSAAHTRARKPLGDIAFLLLARPADVAISSRLSNYTLLEISRRFEAVLSAA